MCDPDSKTIIVCIGTARKPTPKKKILEVLYHEFGHAVAHMYGFSNQWHSLLEKAADEAEEKLCVWLGESVVQELEANKLL